MPRLFHRFQSADALFCLDDFGSPFSIFTVENKNSLPGRQPEHMKEIVRLTRIEGYFLVKPKIMRDKKPGECHCKSSGFMMLT
jgi:hypothetical protein